jgi:hypothetical protein
MAPRNGSNMRLNGSTRNTRPEVACRGPEVVLFEDRWASIPIQTWGFWARYSGANLLLTRNLGIRRDIRDFGVFGAGLVAGAARRDVSTLETETAWRDKRLIVTRCGNWGFNEKSRGKVPRLCSLTPGSAESLLSRVKLSEANPLRNQNGDIWNTLQRVVSIKGCETATRRL